MAAEKNLKQHIIDTLEKETSMKFIVGLMPVVDEPAHFRSIVREELSSLTKDKNSWLRFDQWSMLKDAASFDYKSGLETKIMLEPVQKDFFIVSTNCNLEEAVKKINSFTRTVEPRGGRLAPYTVTLLSRGGGTPKSVAFKGKKVSSEVAKKLVNHKIEFNQALKAYARMKRGVLEPYENVRPTVEVVHNIN